MGRQVWYITTPIYYPSDNLHVGHAYTTVAADALARFHRLRGEEVLFVTGTDEHGQKIQKKADQAGLSPLDFVTPIVDYIRNPLWQRLGISYDDFIRTTEPRHREVVQSIFQTLLDQGDIYKGVYEGWYCLPDESYWTESKLIDGRCPDCGRPVERVRQESYFFRLSRYQDRLRAHIVEHPDFIQPPSRRHEMLNFIDAGLEDLSVSRTGVSWGIAVPGDPDHVIYVWFDALTNYLTAAGYRQDSERFNAVWPPNVQLVGKEIVRFHTVIWPIILMALGVALPTRVFGHGWLLIGQAKMGKSMGNAVDPVELLDRYGVDPVRHYLLREVPFGADGSYTEEALILRTNVDLANDLGNLLSRTTAMIERFAQGRVPARIAERDDGILAQEAARAYREVEAAMEQLAISDALTSIFRLIGRANKYIEEKKPWDLARSDDRVTLHNVLYGLWETLRVVSVLLTPFLLETPDKIREQLGLEQPVENYREAWFGFDAEGIVVRRQAPIFPRIEKNDALATDGKEVDITASATIDDFRKLDFRIGTVRRCEVVDGADRLLKLTVFDGQRDRTIVSGIRPYYRPEELIGQQVVLVANLKPVKVRGIMSEGMLLAGSDSQELSIVAPTKRLAEGARVK
ncbi:MAG: methionine--tRNA ligase [Sulfobacillus acidophilus]|uniref:Methionine--tRNA ligase n=1 Tax=Sulfobacillus acidophilus TaxID=53633 RepID=A0A2T2WH72_9FIRM|nr:MAG: methionine--tRNA ligase [Sulfobacillus acidophilus]